MGVATPPRYRRRGIATALSAAVVGAQFAAGAEAVILTAQDEAAGRMYERIGFRPFRRRRLLTVSQVSGVIRLSLIGADRSRGFSRFFAVQSVVRSTG